MGFPVSVLPKRPPGPVSLLPWGGNMAGFLSGASFRRRPATRRHPILPCPVSPRSSRTTRLAAVRFTAPDRPLYVGVCFAKGFRLSSPKPGHTMGGSRRGARRGGGAGSGRTGCQQNCSPRRRASFAPPKAPKKRPMKVPPEARTSEIRFKLMGEQIPRLTRG